MLKTIMAMDDPASLVSARRARARAAEAQRKAARFVTHREEVRLEASEHQGDYVAPLVERHLGFENRIMSMLLQCLPPGAHNEMHRHSEAIIYVLKGKGFSLIDDVKVEWETGSALHVPAGAWHQHWNSDDENPAWHLLAITQPFFEYTGQYPMESRGGAYTPPDPNFVPVLPWEQSD
jgi:gentisate 1,2-dioxygenase